MSYGVFPLAYAQVPSIPQESLQLMTHKGLLDNFKVLPDSSQILCGITKEFGFAGLAAEFDLLSLVDDALFVAHGTKIVLGDDAGLEWVGFRAANAGGSTAAGGTPG